VWLVWVLVFALIVVAACAVYLVATLRRAIAGGLDDVVRPMVESVSVDRLVIGLALVKGPRTATLTSITLDRGFAEAIAARPPSGFCESVPRAPEYESFEPDLEDLEFWYGNELLFPRNDLGEAAVECVKRRQFDEATKKAMEDRASFVYWTGTIKLRRLRHNIVTIPIRAAKRATGEIRLGFRYRVGPASRLDVCTLRCEVNGFDQSDVVDG